ncbi:MAG: bacitracin ABC transporter ATP-binding protein [Bacillaceae bacterium G1]|nr:MAG: bacitracin ABC transporter ATP-binding protein [Bacillaceae bacterium G1]
MHDWVIATVGLTRRFGRRLAVDRVHLQVGRGDIYGFLGPNGAGKTTTIRMLLGLMRPSAGTVRLFGKDLAEHRLEVLRRVGSLVESPSYYGHLTGRENLEVIRRILRVSRRRIDEVLDVVGLLKDADRPVKGYSLGMKQRLGLAMALLGKPELLILDEPTNGLDPAGIREIRQLIVRLAKEHGMTVLVSSHLLSEVEQMATKVGILFQGRLIFQDSIDVLRRRSRPRVLLGVDRPEEAVRILRQEGVVPEVSPEGIWLPGLEPEQRMRLNARLVQSGIGVYRLQEVPRSLEDIFLELTGGQPEADAS